MARADQPKFVQAGPLRIELSPSSTGPYPTTQDDDLEALTWIIRYAADPGGDDDDLFDAVMSGREWYHHIAEFRPVGEADDLETGRACWRRHTDRELEGELFSMSVASDESIVPLEVVRAAVRQIRELRREHRADPPWLFGPEAEWAGPHPSERDAVLALERRLAEGAVDETALDAAGLLCNVRSAQKLEWLIRWGADRLAERYTPIALSAPDNRLPEPPWLFARTVVWQFPHPSEKLRVIELEGAAAAIDEDERALDGAPDPPELIGRRADLLVRLRDCGLLDRSHSIAKGGCLADWELPALRQLYAAAQQMVEYLRSSARARYNPDAKETEILDAPVCLDIFRGLRLPDGVSLFEWVSWGEYLLRTHGPVREVTADQGDFPYHDQDGLIIVMWRKDAGFPALRYLSLRTGPKASP